jgi:hypothetical protein
MTCGALDLKYRLRGPGEAARQSSSYSGPSVDGAWETFPWGHHLVLLCLVTKLPLLG